MYRPAFIFDDVSLTPANQIDWHSHPQWELSMVLCGAGSRTIGDLTEPMAEGEVILIPPYIPHVWRFDSMYTDAEGNISNITIFFDTSTLGHISDIVPEMAETVTKIKSLKEAVNFKGTAHQELSRLMLGMRGKSPAARVAEMFRLLNVIADADSYLSAGRNNTLSRSEQRLEKIRAFCHCNYARHISIEEISAYVGMNKSAFCTFMRRQTGQTMSEFVNAIRLQRAVEMLRHTDKSIAEIAYDTGFSDVTYFNRLFRKKYRCTPTSMRSGKIV